MNQNKNEPQKYVVNLRDDVRDVVTLSNEHEHLGRTVRIIRTGSLCNVVGKITAAYMATVYEPGGRDVFYTVETPEEGGVVTMITDVHWQDFIRTNS